MNSNILSNKGLSLHNQGKFVEALECYDKALAINSQDVFIIKRRDNTREILHHCKGNMGSGQVIGQESNLNKGRTKVYKIVLSMDINSCSIFDIRYYCLFDFRNRYWS